MKYYNHDTSAFEDEKVSDLFINFGYEGVGLFYVILEKIAKQEKPIKTSVLKKQLRVGKKLEKCWNFMEQIELISSNNGETFNKQLLNFSGKYQIKKEKTAKRVSEWRERQLDTNNVTHYEHVGNADKEKESKVKEIINISFDVFWKLYPKKISKPKCEQKWNKLKNEEREEIIKTLPNFLSYKPFDSYNHPNPETYLNNRRWEDEIEAKETPKIAPYIFGSGKVKTN